MRDCRRRSAALLAFIRWPSVVVAILSVLADRPIQRSDDGLDGGLVGLRGGVTAVEDEATRVDKVGIALLDLLDRCPGRRGAGASLFEWFSSCCRFLAGELGSCVTSTFAA